MSKIEATRSKIELAKSETKTVIKSFIDLVEASSLIMVSVFSIYGTRTYGAGRFWYYPVLVSGVVIALRGGHEFLKYLARK